MFILSQTFTFDAAHTLTRAVPLKEFTGSKRIHGHTYTAKVSICGNVGPSGMVEKFSLKKNGNTVYDLFYLREAIDKVREKLDHHFLDEVEGIGNPTLENLCLFIKKHLTGWPVSEIEVSRPSGDSCRLITEEQKT